MNIFPINPASVRESDHALATERTGRVIAITSGKGGVGKTNVTSNLAIALARQGHRVCVFDADTSLANVNIVMGVTPRYTIEHLLSGERTVEEVLLEGPEGVMIVPAASGIAELAVLDEPSRARLIDALRALESSFDYLLIDTAAGIGESVLAFIRSAQYTILVISTEPTSLTDAFALLRVLKRQAHERPAYVLVNMALNYANSMEVYKRFEGAVRKYLGLKVHYLGYITDDKALKNSIARQRPVLLNDPDALASRCFTTLAAVLGKQFAAPATPLSFTSWWSDQAEASPPPAPSPLGDAGQDRAARPGAGPGPTRTEDEHSGQHARSLPSDEAPADTEVDGSPAAVEAATGPEVDVSAAAVGDSAGPATVDALDELALRLRDLIGEDGLGADRLEPFMESLVELYVARFKRFPLAPGKLARILADTDPGEEEISKLTKALEDNFGKSFNSESNSEQPAAVRQEEIIEEYRRIVARLTAQEEELQRALQRIYDTVDRELGPDQGPALSDQDLL